MLRLVDQSRLTLDDPDPATGHTVRRLLQHTAGVADYGGSADYHAAVAAGGPPWSRSELRHRIGAAPLFPPGEGWAYSNIGYLILRERLEALTGAPLGDALQELVLGPLGVEARLAMTPDDLAGLPGIAPGYHPGWVYHGLLTGGPVEAARMLDGLLNGRLLPENLLSEMLTRRGVNAPLGDRPWSRPGYGLGVMMADAGSSSVIGHTGGGPGSVFAVYSANGRTAAAFDDGGDAAAVERAVIQALA